MVSHPCGFWPRGGCRGTANTRVFFKQQEGRRHKEEMGQGQLSRGRFVDSAARPPLSPVGQSLPARPCWAGVQADGGSQGLRTRRIRSGAHAPSPKSGIPSLREQRAAGTAAVPARSPRSDTGLTSVLLSPHPPVAQKVVATRKKQQLSIGPCKSLPSSPSHASVCSAQVSAVHVSQVRRAPRAPDRETRPSRAGPACPKSAPGRFSRGSFSRRLQK